MYHNEQELKVAVDKLKKSLEANPQELSAALLGYRVSRLLQNPKQRTRHLQYFAKFFEKDPASDRGQKEFELSQFFSAGSDRLYYNLFKSYEYKIKAHKSDKAEHYQKSLEYLGKALEIEPLFHFARTEKQWILQQKNQNYMNFNCALTNHSDVFNVLKMITICLQKCIDEDAVHNKYMTAAKKWLHISLEENSQVTKLYLKKSRVFQKWKQKFPKETQNFWGK